MAAVAVSTWIITKKAGVSSTVAGGRGEIIDPKGKNITTRARLEHGKTPVLTSAAPYCVFTGSDPSGVWRHYFGNGEPGLRCPVGAVRFSVNRCTVRADRHYGQGKLEIENRSGLCLNPMLKDRMPVLSVRGEWAAFTLTCTAQSSLQLLFKEVFYFEKRPDMCCSGLDPEFK